MPPRFWPRFLSAVILAMFLMLLPFSVVVADTLTSSLTTLFASDNQYAGNMFNLTVLSAKNIVIHSFDVNITSASYQNASVSVYYRLGGYSGYAFDASAWTLAGTASVVSKGLNVPTPVSVGEFTLAAGETYGIYITVNNYIMPYIRMYYTNGSATYQNEDLKLTGSIGRGTPIFTGILTPERIWNGTIYYTIQSPAPTQLIIPETGDRAGAWVAKWLLLAFFAAVIFFRLQRKVFSK